MDATTQADGRKDGRRGGADATGGTAGGAAAGGRVTWRTEAEKRAVEAVAIPERWQDRSVYEMLTATARAHPDRAAISFQIQSGPKARAETLTWGEVHARVTRAANALHALHGPGGVTAVLMPNCTEMPLALLGAMTAGAVCPVNPLLEAGQIAAILREVDARVLVTLAPFPKTDIAQKAHAAAALAPGVTHVVEVDLAHYLSPPLKWVVPFMRPRLEMRHKAEVIRWPALLAGARADGLDAAEQGDDTRIAAYFHTGGTTGNPKIAQHRQRGMVYNGRIGTLDFIGLDDVLICPLPMFHVLGAYPVLMSCAASGAHLVMPTPAGYRGDGVMDNFWALVERWGVTFMVMVPTAASALLQRPVNHDVSSLRFAFCGSAPMPVELFRRFEAACGVKILEGYGMTEATCLVSINPPEGERKIGSVGLPFPYTEVRILECDAEGRVLRECAEDEVGEICIMNPGVFPGYKEPERNRGLFTEPDGYLRTGDLGRLDADGYLWITGRSKDLIIRGGHNIDPGIIEQAMAAHPEVAFAGAIGQPDAVAGELPCVYVELCQGATVDEAALLEHARAHVPERGAVPKHLEILDELPKTAVGKVFKPALRKRAIARVLEGALSEAGVKGRIEVIEDKARGLVARVRSQADRETLARILDTFAQPWERRDRDD